MSSDGHNDNGRLRVAAFDFDGTITNCDTLLDIISCYRGKAALAWGLLLTSPWIMAWKAGICSNGVAKEHLFAHFFRGMPLSEFNDLCSVYFKKSYPSIIKSQAAVAVKAHLLANDSVAIVSASIDNWVRPFAEAMGIEHVICTCAEVGPDQRLTGRFSTPNCHGAEKVRRLTQVFGPRDGFFLTAYGDSSGDKQLLQIADQPHYQPF